MTCRILMSAITHKTLNINSLFNQIVEDVSKCDFFRCRDVACRVSMFATTYKTFNINNLSNQIVETQNFASLLLHWNDNFDTPSTIGLDKLLIFNVICAIINVETQRATFLQHQYCNFDTPSLTRQKNSSVWPPCHEDVSKLCAGGRAVQCA